VGIISPVTAQAVRLELRQQLGESVKWIDTEIHDDGEFLLVLVETDLQIESDLTARMLREAAAVLVSFIAPRKGEHAWMVNINHRGALLESDVGGRVQDQ